MPKPSEFHHLSVSVNTGIYADRTWSIDWKRHGFNGCLDTAVEALRFLKSNPVPGGGAQSFNWEHLHNIAQDLRSLHADLLAYHDADRTYTAEATDWPAAWLKNGYQECVPAVIAALKAIADTPVNPFKKEELETLAEHLLQTQNSLFNVPGPVQQETPQPESSPVQDSARVVMGRGGAGSQALGGAGGALAGSPVSVASARGGAGGFAFPVDARLARAQQLGAAGVATYNAQLERTVEYLRAQGQAGSELLEDIAKLRLPVRQ